MRISLSTSHPTGRVKHLQVCPPPIDVGSARSMVVTQHRALGTFLLKTPRWWFELRHVIIFLQLREQVHSAWRVISLERQLGVTGRHLRHPLGHPSNISETVFTGLDPKYVISVSVTPHLHTGIVSDASKTN